METQLQYTLGVIYQPRTKERGLVRAPAWFKTEVKSLARVLARVAAEGAAVGVDVAGGAHVTAGGAFLITAKQLLTCINADRRALAQYWVR